MRFLRLILPVAVGFFGGFFGGCMLAAVLAQDAAPKQQAKPSPTPAVMPAIAPLELTPQQLQLLSVAQARIETAQAQLERAQAQYRELTLSLFLELGGSKATHEAQIVALDQQGKRVGFPAKAQMRGEAGK